MKQWMLLSVLTLNFLLNGQELKTIQIQKETKESDYFPQIDGVFEGEINIISLASDRGIYTEVGWVIQSYRIDYPSGRDFVSKTVQGHQIPEEIIRDIVKGALKELVFITDIIAVDLSGSKHLLKSMALTPIPSDE